MNQRPKIPSKDEFANCLKEYLPFIRKMSGWSVEQIVDLSECPRAFYEGYEQGVVPDWDLAANHVLGLALVFDIPSAMLLGMQPFDSMENINKAIIQLQNAGDLINEDAEYFASLPFREKLWAVYYMLTGEDKGRGYSDMTDLVKGIRNNHGTVPSRKWGQPRLMDALDDFDRYPDSLESDLPPTQSKPN